MSYSKASFINNSEKTSPCFRTLLIGNISNNFWLTGLYRRFRFKYIFVSPTNFLVKSNRPRILYIIILPNESQDFLKSGLPNYRPVFFLRYLKNAEFVVSSWYIKPKSTLIIIYSAYRFKLECRMLDKILHVVRKVIGIDSSYMILKYVFD